MDVEIHVNSSKQLIYSERKRVRVTPKLGGYRTVLYVLYDYATLTGNCVRSASRKIMHLSR